MKIFALLTLFFVGPLFAASYLSPTDRFRLVYEFEVPPLKEGQRGQIWVPIASSDNYQKVTVTSVSDVAALSQTSETQFHNQAKHLSFTKADEKKRFSITYDVVRQEKGAYPNTDTDIPRYLRSEPMVPLNARFKKIAAEVTAGKKTTADKGRAIYDYVLSVMKYDKSGSGWGRGDAVYACDSKTGNCTDFHALFIAIARSAKIPSRFAIGFTIPTDKNSGAIDGYHCWAEFLADGKWIPVDISEAWKHPEEREYYFGHHPANRIEISRGRELRFSPFANQAPINFMVHPYLEIDGKAGKFTGTYSFSRTPADRM